MPIPTGLHFDPIELASKVDPSISKKYEMPYKGQTFVQLHQGGTHIVVGTCVGLDMHMDRSGVVTAWRASIESKFTTASGITNGSTWRDASEWHPAPLTQQESVTDVRDALNKLAEQVRLLEERSKSDHGWPAEDINELQRINNTVQAFTARLIEGEDRFAAVDERLKAAAEFANERLPRLTEMLTEIFAKVSALEASADYPGVTTTPEEEAPWQKDLAVAEEAPAEPASAPPRSRFKK